METPKEKVFVISLDSLNKISTKKTAAPASKKTTTKLSGAAGIGGALKSGTTGNRLLVSRRNTTTPAKEAAKANIIKLSSKKRPETKQATPLGSFVGKTELVPKRPLLKVATTVTFKSTRQPAASSGIFSRAIGAASGSSDIFARYSQATTTKKYGASMERIRVQRFGQLLHASLQNDDYEDEERAVVVERRQIVKKSPFTLQNRLEMRAQRFVTRKVSSFADEEKKEQRKRRFSGGSITDKQKAELRKKRFEVPAAKNLMNDPQLLAQRQKRFGTKADGLTEQQKNSSRFASFAEMFGETAAMASPAMMSIPLNSSEEQRKLMRAAKFGSAKPTATVSTAPVQATEKDKKAKRAARFGAVGKDLSSEDISSLKRRRISV
eukprot:TRINITY_DN4747_c0_g1_i1.p1 TRINITY_DN4747_c0_g1~~TRINITY_DN4747_c0_g1_i1.p1  ORF type:complete len:380 (+),score=84.64 TRINITY_DN4747_c0_g1_i1:146-1285(+)